MTPTTKDAYRLLHEGTLALSQIENAGIRIDVPLLDKTIKDTEDEIKEIEKRLRSDKTYDVWRNHFGMKTNLGSDQQLATVVFDKLGYECKAVTRTKKKSASAKNLQDVDLPFVKDLLHMEDLKKTVGTFLKGMRKETCDGFLHPSFDLNTAASFRSSSSRINFQNLPRRNPKMAALVRSCIVPRKGRHFWEIDFKGIEVCVNACINKDPVLLKYVRTDPGAMHRDAAADLFMVKKDQVAKPVRDRAKNQFVFASFYGSYYCQTARGLWEDIARTPGEFKLVGSDTTILDHLKSKGIDRLGDCNPRQSPEDGTFEGHVKGVEDLLWRRFKVYKQWRDDHYNNYVKNGYFDTPTGFRCSWGKGGLMSRNDTISYPAQGSAFHCLLWTVIRLQKWLNKSRMRTKMVGQIHDSAEIDSPAEELPYVAEKALKLIEEDLPKHWPWIIVSMQVEVEVSPKDRSWHEKKLWKVGDSLQ